MNLRNCKSEVNFELIIFDTCFFLNINKWPCILLCRTQSAPYQIVVRLLLRPPPLQNVNPLTQHYQIQLFLYLSILILPHPNEGGVLFSTVSSIHNITHIHIYIHILTHTQYINIFHTFHVLQRPCIYYYFRPDPYLDIFHRFMFKKIPKFFVKFYYFCKQFFFKLILTQQISTKCFSLKQCIYFL